MNILRDTPIEVTETQYNRLMRECSGIVAGRKDGDKHFIKVWIMRYADYVKQIILTTK